MPMQKSFFAPCFFAIFKAPSKVCPVLIISSMKMIFFVPSKGALFCFIFSAEKRVFSSIMHFFLRRPAIF